MIKTYNHRMKEDLFQKSRVCTLDAEGKMHEKRLETATQIGLQVAPAVEFKWDRAGSQFRLLLILFQYDARASQHDLLTIQRVSCAGCRYRSLCTLCRHLQP